MTSSSAKLADVASTRTKVDDVATGPFERNRENVDVWERRKVRVQLWLWQHYSRNYLAGPSESYSFVTRFEQDGILWAQSNEILKWLKSPISQIWLRV
ncbi:hypothetical protein YC2023_059978 [Brassica napus]